MGAIASTISPRTALQQRADAPLLEGLPPQVASALWNGTDLGSPVTETISTGFAALDRELPGQGWPCRSLTEILSAQPSTSEWRLLGPGLRAVVANRGQVVVIGPPKHPHLPGLHHAGLDERHLVWIRADTPAERLWCTEQLVRANAAGALLAWLPQARPEQIRRLQVLAQACDGPVFLLRPDPAQHEASAAPLRLQVGVDVDWRLSLHLLKRRGPPHDGVLLLESIPGGLHTALTPRLRRPSRLLSREVEDVVVSPALPARARRVASTH